LTRLVSIFLISDAIPDYLCLALTAIAGLLLEVYQSITKTGQPEFLDYVAVMLPALALYVLEINLL
jgi:hypothetical protein